MCEETVFTELKVQFQRNSGIPHLRPSHEGERALQKKQALQKELMKIL